MAKRFNKSWNMKTGVIPIVIGALETRSGYLKERLGKVASESKIIDFQKTATFYSAGILRKTS